MSERRFHILSTKNRRSDGDLCCWWGPNQSGYVYDLDSAGRYSETETAQIIAHSEPGHSHAVPVELAEAYAVRVVSSEKRRDLMAPAVVAELRARIAQAVEMIEALDDLGDGLVEVGSDDLTKIIDLLRDKPT